MSLWEQWGTEEKRAKCGNFGKKRGVWKTRINKKEEATNKKNKVEEMWRIWQWISKYKISETINRQGQEIRII